MMSSKSILRSVLSLAAALIFFGPEARAQFHTGPVASAMGGAGRAAVDPGEAGYLNPAALAHLHQYIVGGNFTTGTHPSDGKRTEWGALLADNSPGNLVAGAFSYQRRNSDFDGGLNVLQQDLQASLAGFVHRHIALGVSAHRQYYQPSGGSDETQDNAHLGMLYTPNEYLGFGLTAYDVFPGNESVPVGFRVVPTFGFGSHVIIREIFRLRLDLVHPNKFNDDHRTDVMVGLESYFREDFAFRLGGNWKETADQMWVTTGLGFKGPKLSFDYTFEKDVRQADGSRHLFDLWLPF